MTYNETMQWLIDNKAECTPTKIDGVFCLKIAVKDPHDGKDYHMAFCFEESSFVQKYLSPIVEALDRSVNSQKYIEKYDRYTKETLESIDDE
ncbi:hypothetical protein LCGC14_1133930 [marine sediment metagenome]|uniref:Uncharacterized protein n=1 Tax=marine sediment metagenome TaxID=412755 RepID=A0A0F9Q644_9ZZZZ